jgi:hypothetical protein
VKRGWNIKPSLAPRKVEGMDRITKAWNGTGKRKALKTDSLGREPARGSLLQDPDSIQQAWRSISSFIG